MAKMSELDNGKWECPRVQESLSKDECRTRRRFCRYCASCLDGRLVETYVVQVKYKGQVISSSPI